MPSVLLSIVHLPASALNETHIGLNVFSQPFDLFQDIEIANVSC
jgi:hypothetical protein